MQFGENEFHIMHGEGMGGDVRTEFGVPPSRLICDRDTLCCGPLTSLGDPEEWDRLRLAYWATVETREPEGSTLWQQLVAVRDRLANADAIALNGIEDRIGGVTLTTENHWLFDGKTLVQ
ncbi:MAG: hypothetical protein IMF05_08395, partial [Proteobacteria bacterium]|nr:hypothetical protein [Pseudomonadota bacterium]